MSGEAFSLCLSDGATIRCQRFGSPTAPTLCLVSGLGGTADFWTPIIPVLAKQFNILLYDHRGTGESSLSQIDYSITQMTNDLLQVLDALSIGSALFIGHSTGGAISQTLALDYPDRVKGIVLSSTWAGPDPYFTSLFQLRLDVLKKLGAAAYLTLGDILLHSPEIIAKTPSWIPVTDKEAMAKLKDTHIVCSRICALMAHDRREDISKISAPAMVVCARDDQVTPAHMSHELAELLPGANLAVTENGGHFLPRSQPSTYIDTILPFLSEVAFAS